MHITLCMMCSYTCIHLSYIYSLIYIICIGSDDGELRFSPRNSRVSFHCILRAYLTSVWSVYPAYTVYPVVLCIIKLMLIRGVRKHKFSVIYMYTCIHQLTQSLVHSPTHPRTSNISSSHLTHSTLTLYHITHSLITPLPLLYW